MNMHAERYMVLACVWRSFGECYVLECNVVCTFACVVVCGVCVACECELFCLCVHVVCLFVCVFCLCLCVCA